ncbi:hypothetical protein JZU46_04820 [bacterium]|jgi:hypothetical protein|nr:hypothetical protein [bacterium]
MFNKLVLIIFVSILAGCATPASQQAMSVAMQDLPASLNANLKGQVNVNNVTGGKDTNPMWTSQVDTQGFKGALDKSIAMAGYKANDSNKAKYSVDADLMSLNQPMFGFTFDVVSSVLYTVNGEGKQRQIPITATGTASTSDAFVGVERLRIANERSIKENIRLFLQRLSDQVGM